MQKESVVTVTCSAVGRAVELTLCYAAMNGYGCAVDCSCVDGSCSAEANCGLRCSSDCELLKWMQDDLM